MSGLMMGRSSDPIHQRPVTPASQYRDPTMNDAELVLGAGRGDYTVVRKLLDKGVDVNARCPPPLGVLNGGKAEVVGVYDDRIDVIFGDENHRFTPKDLTKTALQAAAGGGHDDVVKLLIEKGANINAPPAKSFGRTALQSAAGGGHKYVVDLLVQHDADIKAQPGDWYGRTALQAAAEGGYVDVVRLLINGGANVNEQPAPQNGKTALQAAAACGDGVLVQLLIDKGADINALPAAKFGRTALQAAAEGGHKKVVEMLIAKGADVNAPSSEVGGKLALKAAIDSSHIEVQELLKDAGAFENQREIEFTVGDRLVLAAEQGDCEVVKRLLEDGAEVDARCPPYGKFNNGRVQVGNADQAANADTAELEVTFDEWWSMKAEKKLFARTALQAAADCGYGEVVKLLLEKGADVDAPPAEESGRTALQAAAEGGYSELVELLIEKKADINAKRARRNGRTALQAAVEGSHENIYILLIKHGASTDEEEIGFSDEDLFILAAGRGDLTTVNQLLNRVDLTSRCLPPLPSYFTYWDKVRRPKQEKFGYFAGTALQAAAVGGHKEVVKLLIEKGADVDAGPAKIFGRTALQAAAERGDEEMVDLLLENEASLGIPPAIKGGKTELQAAAAGWHERVLKRLIEAGTDVNEQNHEGQTILHEACKAGDVPGVVMLLDQLDGLHVHAKDYSGSTPLHVAVKERQKSIVRYLVQTKHVDKEIKNNAGQTPLQVALEEKFRDILGFLIQEGARINGLEVEKLLCLLDLQSDSSKHGQSAIILQMGQHQGRFIKGAEARRTKISVLTPSELIIPSIHLYSSSTDYAESFVDPRVYLEGFNFPGRGGGDAVSSWGWLAFDDRSRYSARFEKDIPTNTQVRSSKNMNVILVGYVYFETFFHSPRGLNKEGGGKEEEGELIIDDSLEKVRSFEMKIKRVEISWIMTELHNTISSSGAFRSVKYRGTLNMKSLFIPHHGVEFFALFLDDIHKGWLELFKKAREHLVTVRNSQLENHGKTPYLTKCLLDDSREWGKLRALLQQQISKSKDLLSDFNSSELLYTELIPDGSDRLDGTEENKGASGYQIVDSDKKTEKRRSGQSAGSPVAGKFTQGYELQVIEELSEKIGVLEELWEKEMSSLENETMQMIELEFNLVSIYEAGRSISMSVSMKRLSWISFIFLPLAFVSGLFGMNVDLLDSNPSWLIYLAFALPLMALVFLVWLAFKYIRIERWIERRMGSRLGSILRHTKSPAITGKDSEPRDPAALVPSDSVKSEPEYLGGTSSGQTHIDTIHTHWLSRRPKSQPIDEEKGPISP